MNNTRASAQSAVLPRPVQRSVFKLSMRLLVAAASMAVQAIVRPSSAGTSTVCRTASEPDDAKPILLLKLEVRS